MSRRYKAFSFDDRTLLVEGLTRDIFYQIFQQLPEDAKIIRFGRHDYKAAAYFVVESKEFDVIPESEIIPEEYLQLTKPIKIESKFQSPLATQLIKQEVLENNTEWEQAYLDVNRQIMQSCECGAETIKSKIHSDWCPKHGI